MEYSKKIKKSFEPCGFKLKTCGIYKISFNFEHAMWKLILKSLPKKK